MTNKKKPNTNCKGSIEGRHERHRGGAYAALLWLALLCPMGFAHAQETVEQPLDTQLNEQVLSIPGDLAHPVMLQVTLFEPNGPGPFPLAVLNHGKDKGDPHTEPRYRSAYAYAARYFLSRGYAVVLPMLRGFAGSGGQFNAMGCDAEDEGVHQARDIRAVIYAMDRRHEIDTSRIVVSGQSYGGWNTLALGTLNIAGVKGLVDFAGGRNAPLCPTWPADLAIGAGHYGQQTQVPSIWFYGDNDSKFSVPTWRSMYDHYTAAGGHVELVAYGSFKKDSHNFLGSVEALPIWMPRVDAFLARIGLPSQNLHPELLPANYPAPTHFAAIDDVKAIPLVNDKGRQAYQEFLTRESPRVFAITQDGGTVTTNGGYDPLAHAMDLCKEHGRECRIYAVDDEVVWPLPTPVPPPSHFAALDDVSAVPLINDRGRLAYREFLNQKAPRVFVIAPDGASVGSHGGFDPLARALDICKKNGRTCQPYAVDDQVVWAGVATKTAGQ